MLIEFKPYYTAKDGSVICYIEDDFVMHYAPHVAHSIDMCWEDFPQHRGKFSKMLEKAVGTVKEFKIRDKKDQWAVDYVLQIADKLLD